MLRRFGRLLLLGVAVASPLLAGGPREARADLIPVFLDATPVSGGYEYSYRLDLSQNFEIRTGDFFTIYDFLGFTGATTQPADWSFSAQNVGITPPQPSDSGDAGVIVADSPNIVNLTWTYTGAATVSPGPDPLTNVGVFTAASTVPPGRLGFYSGRDTRASGDAFGTKGANAGLTVVPIPEPSSVVLMGLGGLAVVGLSRFRRRRLALA